MKNNMYLIPFVALSLGFGLNGTDEQEKKNPFLRAFDYIKTTNLVTGYVPAHTIKEGEIVPEDIAAIKENNNKIGHFRLTKTLRASEEIEVKEKKVLLNKERKVVLGLATAGILYWQREKVGEALTWFANVADATVENIFYWIGSRIAGSAEIGYLNTLKKNNRNKV